MSVDVKTKAVVDKYTTIIQGLLKTSKPIRFKVQARTSGPWLDIGSLIDKDKPSWTHNWQLGYYQLLVGKDIAATWRLYQMPHCCAICVSCEAYVDHNFRGKRLGTVLNNLRKELSTLLGYSLLLCTDITKNEYQRKLLKTNGWNDLYTVYNRRTGNEVVISVVNT